MASVDSRILQPVDVGGESIFGSIWKEARDVILNELLRKKKNSDS
jgi:hypothetical protein